VKEGHDIALLPVGSTDCTAAAALGTEPISRRRFPDRAGIMRGTRGLNGELHLGRPDQVSKPTISMTMEMEAHTCE